MKLFSTTLFSTHTLSSFFNHLYVQSRDLSKFISKSHAKRLPLTTKRAGKGYYKGNRCRKEGYLDSKGKYIHIYYYIRIHKPWLPLVRPVHPGERALHRSRRPGARRFQTQALCRCWSEEEYKRIESNEYIMTKSS